MNTRYQVQVRTYDPLYRTMNPWANGTLRYKRDVACDPGKQQLPTYEEARRVVKWALRADRSSLPERVAQYRIQEVRSTTVGEFRG